MIAQANVLIALLGAATGSARAAESRRFAVVNLSGEATPAVLLTTLEGEIERLIPGSSPIQEASMRALLAGAATPADAAPSLAEAALAAAAARDCEVALGKAREAEQLALASLATRDARDVLEKSYVAQVLCGDAVKDQTLRTTAFRRLRALGRERPEALDEALWDTLVAETPAASAADAELLIDSEPPNAQIFVDFRNVGTTPATLKVARGEVLIELEKEGYKKAFRRLDVDTPEKRTVFRLIDRQHDRAEMVAAALKILGPADPAQRLHTLAQVAQWARADLLVLVRVDTDPNTKRVEIWQFDAERGALAKDTISSPFDPDTGRIEALAMRQVVKREPEQPAGILSPRGAKTLTVASDKRKSEADESMGLGGKFEERAVFRGPRKTKPPWWSYLIALGVIGLVTALVVSDHPRAPTALDVKATWEGR